MKSFQTYYRRYYNKKRYYSSIFDKYTDIDTYIELFDRASEASRTETPIRLRSRFAFGTSIDTLKTELKKPVEQVSRIDGKIEILLYKQVIGNLKARVELHFLSGKLFFYKVTFPFLKKKNEERILSIIAEKYLQHEGPLKPISVIDPEGNWLFTAAYNLDLEVHYLSGEPSVRESLQVIRDEVRGEEESLQTRIDRDLKSNL